MDYPCIFKPTEQFNFAGTTPLPPERQSNPLSKSGLVLCFGNLYVSESAPSGRHTHGYMIQFHMNETADVPDNDVEIR